MKCALILTITSLQVKGVLNQQSEEWSNLISQQVKEELDLYDIHSPQVYEMSTIANYMLISRELASSFPYVV
jgi:hypothetical protein